MALTNKLSNIATAIREKTGTTELMTLDEMPTAIAGISGGGSGGECTKHHIPDELITITGDCSYRFAGSGWGWLLLDLSDYISTKNVTSVYHMFQNNTITEIPIEINISDNISLNSLLYDARLTKAPYIVGKPYRINGVFSYCPSLSEIPNDWHEKIDWSDIHSSESDCDGIFLNCYSLRSIPDNLMKNLWSKNASNYSNYLYGMFQSCYVLQGVSSVPVKNTFNSNVLTSTFYSLNMASYITFEMNEDSTPIVANWKNQTIDLTKQYYPVGFASSYYNITNYSAYHGITTATRVTDDASYQALKDSPDWWTTDVAYSRYNHDSAVNTINSLPDTSAYLATAGGTNTIKFKGAAGSKTDGGAINTLTPEEISIAAAKGWTVTLV